MVYAYTRSQLNDLGLHKAVQNEYQRSSYSVHIRTVPDTIEHETHAFSAGNTGTRTRCERFTTVISHTPFSTITSFPNIAPDIFREP